MFQGNASHTGNVSRYTFHIAAFLPPNADWILVVGSGDGAEA